MRLSRCAPLLAALLLVGAAAGADSPPYGSGRITELTPARVALDSGFGCERRKPLDLSGFQVGDYASLDCIDGVLDNVERSLVLIDTRSGAIDRGFPDVEPIPSSLAADGRGGWFVPAARLGSAPVRGIVHLRHDGTLDRAWKPHLRSGARANDLVLVGRRLYASIRFGSGGNRVGVEAIDATTGRRLWSSTTFAAHRGNGSVGSGDLRITALAASSSAVYVAGAFGAVGKHETTGEPVVALDPRNGRLLGWRLQSKGLRASSPDTDVEALAVSGTRLYLGGSAGVEAVSTVSGAVEPWQAGFSGDEVTAIAPVGRTVLVGGTFDFEAFDAQTGLPQPWTSRLGGSAGCLAVAGTTVFLGGDVRSGFGSGFNAPHAGVSGDKNNLASVSLATGRFRSWAPHVSRYVSVAALAVSGDSVLASGEFDASLG